MTMSATWRPGSGSTLQAGGSHGILGLSGLDIAVAMPYGEVPVPALPEPRSGPVAALETVLREALLRPPTVVAFSGGRDSSALLAVAARVARREGLEPPIAATQRFPDVATSQESDWQEAVIRHVGVRDWEILTPGEDLDVIGPIATAALSRHGPLSPPNAHFVVPMAELARGGTLVTGLDGDLVLGGWRWARMGALLRGALRPQARDLLRAGLFAAPRRVQQQWLTGQSRIALPWLTSEAGRAVAELRGRQALVQPRRFDRFVDWARRRRHLAVLRRQYELIGDDAGARVAHPLIDERFLAAYGAAGGRRGFGDRTAVMRALFADALPGATLSRGTKATFDGAFLGERAREFAARWDGAGVDPELIDVAALMEDWRGPAISFRSSSLMQWLWLREQAGTT
jgi:asparagine synthase